VRAREPDVAAHVECNGVKVGYEVFGDGAPTLLLVPAWTIIHSRFWKLQVPYLARHFRVITFDRPGNGRSDRSADPRAYTVAAVTDQALAVLDATGTDRAVLISLSQGFLESVELAAHHPERVLGAIFIAPSSKLDPDHRERAEAIERFLDPYPADPQRWERLNAQYWLDHYEDFAQFFFGECFPEPHSTKQVEDCLGWAAQTTPEVLLTDVQAAVGPEAALTVAEGVSARTLVICGSDDRIAPVTRSQALAKATGGELAVLEGAGHIPLARDPVRVNLLIREFVDKLAPRRTAPARWPRARQRTRRALFVSSPIGLGHARRDIAIAAELRRRHPDLEIDWLAQHPVTRMLADAGERVHPASRLLASESAHIEAESGEHRLHCFQAWRRMDEILAADFMVFHDVIDDHPYDLVIGDEAWEIDYFLHENPELKRFAYCWLTDFVGWLPMPEGGGAEAALTADYNAEMIEQIARYPRVRDLALFVGNPDDIVPDRFGDGLPKIRDWVRDHYRFPGYITGFDTGAVADRDQLRTDLGYGRDEQVCVVTVGGSGVGSGMLRRVIDAFPRAASKVDGLRMIVVAGPRIDPASLPSPPGVEVLAYVPHLYRHLAASDLAVVQGGLTTCMELTATRRPFIYLPLRQHFEQTFHVHHRLRAHRAGLRMDFGDADSDALASAIADQIARPVDYRPVERDGASQAAAAIADLV
jgi:pimeloyl-ACP methyl ester carboxylesterase/predicted glycosyltransferase